VNDTPYVLAVIFGLTAVSVINRSFFFLSRRELVLSDALKRGLRYAPLAALLAVIAPEVAATDSAQPWRDPRPWAALAAVGYGLWKRNILGTILVGMSVLLALKLGFKL
jgi:branched-subunit amino acid transport protein